MKGLMEPPVWSMKIIFLLLSLSIGLVWLSCYPGDSLSVTEMDTVTTFKKKDASFRDKQTYAMPDSVVFIDRDGNVYPRANNMDSEIILSAIARNMQTIGYNRVVDPDAADLHVLPVVTVTEWKGGGCYPSWWCGWWSCYPGC